MLIRQCYSFKLRSSFWCVGFKGNIGHLVPLPSKSAEAYLVSPVRKSCNRLWRVSQCWPSWHTSRMSWCHGRRDNTLMPIIESFAVAPLRLIFKNAVTVAMPVSRLSDVDVTLVNSSRDLTRCLWLVYGVDLCCSCCLTTSATSANINERCGLSDRFTEVSWSFGGLKTVESRVWNSSVYDSLLHPVVAIQIGYTMLFVIQEATNSDWFVIAEYRPIHLYAFTCGIAAFRRHRLMFIKFC